ncbi:prenyltransferase/squalene oxidase repeat-containing protein [Salipaludibacillus neizhouensis]|uniref:hypothetical protein n=1 Tax=Salipaludibacillus neizhouensis TaxID=885475 RepID=UPI001CBA6223|nr:hypothetical protein [Salipaludibacillus neizhouensis]
MYKKMVALNDQITESYFEKQVVDDHSKYLGGIINVKTGIPSPSHVGTAAIIAGWVCSYVNPDSKYYQKSSLRFRLNSALDYMVNQQHEDGTISPGWTNYHSPPDTAFIVTGFAQIYLLLKEKQSGMVSDLINKVELFLERTIPAMLNGGCHTPNHRWVLTSALAHLYNIFEKRELVNRAEEWLLEGIDISEDGEWTERSNGIYNSVSDIFLYHTAKLLNKPELLDSVRKNLEMMEYLIHPNGEVVTDYSSRQDFGVKFDLSPYHLIYRLMAVHDNNSTFATMADLAVESLTDMGPANNHIMLGYLVYPFVQKMEVEKENLVTDYEVFINEHYPLSDNLLKMENVGHHSKIEHSSMHTSFGAPIIRYRKDETSATIMGRTPSFFSLRHGNASLLATQIFTSFTPGLIELDSLETIQGGYHLEKLMQKGYKGPIPSQCLSESIKGKPTESPWYLLPHQDRELTHNQYHKLDISILPDRNDWIINIRTDERKDVFTQIVFIFDANGNLSGKGLIPQKNSYFWKDDKLLYEAGGDKITLTSGAHEHWMEDIQHINQSHGAQIVKVNLLSPVNKTFHLKLE